MADPFAAEKKRERNRAYYAANKELIAAQRHGSDVVKRGNLARYGLTLEDYRAMREKQGGKCAACADPTSERGAERSSTTEHVDHCHATGKVRGLLCARCNVALGMARDDIRVLRGLIEYLEKQ